MANFEAKVTDAVWKLVHETTLSLTGDRQLEDDVKRAVAPNHH